MKTILKEEGFPLNALLTYTAMIKGAVGSFQYQKLYVETPNGPRDVIKDGDLACAYFVSCILTLCALTNGGVHTTVVETIIDLEESGWLRIDTPQAGAVIVWEEKMCSDGRRHAHIGFAVSSSEAVSNSAIARSPEAHHVTYGDVMSPVHRKIVAIFAHPEFVLGNL